MKINKERALFWLNRRHKELKGKITPPTHEQLAQAGVSYAERNALIQAKAKEAEDAHGELVSLEEVIAFIEERA